MFAAVLGRVRRECAQILGAAGAADMSLVWASLFLALFGLGGVTPAIMAVAEGLGPGVSR